jgi:hypothetical protein
MIRTGSGSKGAYLFAKLSDNGLGTFGKLRDGSQLNHIFQV